MNELQINLDGVKLPSDDWVNIPGTWLQVRTKMTDPVGTVYVRRNPEAVRPAPEDRLWMEFEEGR